MSVARLKDNKRLDKGKYKGKNIFSLMVSFEGDMGIVLFGTMELSSKCIHVWCGQCYLMPLAS